MFLWFYGFNLMNNLRCEVIAPPSSGTIVETREATDEPGV
jgi:hypothetical protein